MSLSLSLLLAVAGTVLTALGGFVLGRWWEARAATSLHQRAERQINDALRKVLVRFEGVDHMASAVDPLVRGGRSALTAILEKVRDIGGYAAVVVSDDHGLILAACGPDESAELMAVEAAAFGNTSGRVRGGQQSILQTQPDRRWTIHRYFTVEDGLLCLSATRQGGSPRVDALDGALAAFERVLAHPTESAA